MKIVTTVFIAIVAMGCAGEQAVPTSPPTTACSFAAPASIPIPWTGATVSVPVQAVDGCSWVLLETSPEATILTGPHGTGVATSTVRVAENLSGARTLKLVLAAASDGTIWKLVDLVQESVPVVAPSAPTFLWFQSEPDEYVGRGQVYLYQPTSATFLAQTTIAGDSVTISAEGRDDWPRWSLNIRRLNGQALEPGEYDFGSNVGNVTASFGGNARGCDGSGRVNLINLVGTSGIVERLHVRFEQRCRNTPSLTLKGEVWFVR